MKALKFFVLVLFLGLFGYSSVDAGPNLAPGLLDVGLWPDGVVHYRYCHDDEPDCPDFTGTEDTALRQGSGDKKLVRDMMDVWEDALTVTDPLTGQARKYVRFVKCTDDCPESHVLIRYNLAGQTNNMCTYFEGGVEKVGRNPNGQTVYHLTGPGQQPDVIVLHELGHCLGLWHEQNRQDRDRWLLQFPTPGYCAGADNCTGDYQNVSVKVKRLLPLLGNYDYDSIMHYPSYNGRGELRWTDPVSNTFLGSTWEIRNVAPSRDLLVSKRDVSRVLQYYAHERDSNWGFFRSLSYTSQSDPAELPYPYLAERVEAAGTPAIAYQSPGNYDLFARGSDNQLYWKMYRLVEHTPFSFVGWRSIGCCFTSDPSAVSRGEDRIDVVAINDSGDVQRIKYIEGTWHDPLTLRGGHPSGGIKQAEGGGYIGPAIASRGMNSLDVFVVRDDGRLAVTTWEDGNWGAWHTLGQGYDVTARPAAVALSATQVQLAINAGDVNLYEPVVTFPDASFALGNIKATTAPQSPPALAKRDGGASRYHVLITNAAGRISYRLSRGAWRDVGGIPKSGTGPSAVATGDLTFRIVMNGEDATSCTVPFCHPNAPNPGQVIQPGGLWIRDFE